jgi:hypothetical protein
MTQFILAIGTSPEDVDFVYRSINEPDRFLKKNST